MEQEIRTIKVRDLVLWSENPRDPIGSAVSAAEVIKRAVEDPKSKWNLKKLAREMGDYYDYSELPIVVYKNHKPVVYDGNRRVALAKIKLGLVSVEGMLRDELPSVPEELPCNVCEEEVALQSVFRKHVKLRNSWGILERDIFAYRYQKSPKSFFLMLDECTGGFISSNPELNRGFVKNELLTKANLQKIGFCFDSEKMMTPHSNDEVGVILDNILEKVKEKTIDTRTNRGKLLTVLDQRVKDIIRSNNGKEQHEYVGAEKGEEKRVVRPVQKKNTERKTRITQGGKVSFFGEKLILKPGDVNNLYSDILMLYNMVSSTDKPFSPNVYALFRMALRLLCETAMRELGLSDIKDYIKRYAPVAKKKFSRDIATLLSSQNVKIETLPQLLHTGAHSYTSSVSHDQAVCISIFVGAMLKESHGK